MSNPNPSPSRSDAAAIAVTAIPVDTNPPATARLYLWVYQADDRTPEAVAFASEEAARGLPPETRGKRTFKRGLFHVDIDMTHLTEVK